MTLTERPELLSEPAPTPLLSARYRWATVGMVGLVFLAAFEALAVTTIMPAVSAELDGRSWFSAAFSATLAASVVGMVAGGLWSDRHGPRLPLLVSVAVFAAGLLLAGLAPGIELFVAARFLQGLGSGAMTVALYVVVARIYAPVDHPRIFGAFAAAWVIPSMIGPTIAGVVAETAGWRWVFLGVVALAAAATAMLLPGLRDLVDHPEPSEVATTGRLALAALVAVSVVVLDLAGRSAAAIGVAVAAVALIVVLAAVRPLLPARTLVLGRGLPSVIALRAAVAATFFATEIYIPYLLQGSTTSRPGSPASRSPSAPWAGPPRLGCRPGSVPASTTGPRCGSGPRSCSRASRACWSPPCCRCRRGSSGRRGWSPAPGWG